jgi:TPR repeat protein
MSGITRAEAELQKPPVAVSPSTNTTSKAVGLTAAQECDRLVSADFDLDAPYREATRTFAQITSDEVELALMTCERAVRSDPDQRRFRFQLGRVYDKKRMFDRAKIEYEQATRMGSAAALINLGELYRLGQGVPAADARMAQSKFCEAAKLGNPTAKNYCAHRLEGSSSQAERELARRYYDEVKVEARREEDREEAKLGLMRINEAGIFTQSTETR